MAILKYDQVSLPAWSPSAFITAGTNAINTGLTNIGNALKGFRDDQQNAARNEFMAGLANQADTDAAQQYMAANQSLLQRAGAQTAMDAMAKRSGLITDAGRLLENQKAQEAIDAQNELNAYGDLRAQIKEKILKGDTVGLAALMQKANGMGLKTNTINELFKGDPLDTQYKKAQIYSLGLTNRDKQLQLNIAPAIDYLGTNWGNAKTTEEQQGVYNHAISLLKTPEERNAFRLAMVKYGYKPMEGGNQYVDQKINQPQIDPTTIIKDEKGNEVAKLIPGVTGKNMAADIAAGESEADRAQYGMNMSQFLPDLQKYDQYGSDIQGMFAQLAKDKGIKSEDTNKFIGQVSRWAKDNNIAPSVVATVMKNSPVSNETVWEILSNPFYGIEAFGNTGLDISQAKQLQSIYSNKPVYGSIVERRAKIDKYMKAYDAAEAAVTKANEDLITATRNFKANKNESSRRIYEAAQANLDMAKQKLSTAYANFQNNIKKRSLDPVIKPKPDIKINDYLNPDRIDN